MPQILATSTGPPSASMTCLATSVLSMTASIGVPISLSIGVPVGPVCSLPSMNTLKERLASAMAGPPKITQQGLATAAGVKQSSVNDWLSGKSKSMRGDNLIAVAKHLKVNPSWLATGKGQREMNVKGDVGDVQPASQSDAFDPVILSRALIYFEYERKGYGYPPTHPLRLAQRLIDLYQQTAADGGDLTPEHSAEITEAIRRHKAKSPGGVKRGTTKRAGNH